MADDEGVKDWQHLNIGEKVLGGACGYEAAVGAQGIHGPPKRPLPFVLPHPALQHGSHTHTHTHTHTRHAHNGQEAEGQVEIAGGIAEGWGQP